MIKSATPILVTSDVLRTVAFYKQVIGFESSWLWGDPPTFAGVSWGNVSLMFTLDASLAQNLEGHPLWIDVEEIDDLYSKHLERGAEIVSPIEDKPWDRREYTVRDPSGYLLRFGAQPGHVSKGTGVFPEGVTIEARMPTREEHDRITKIVFSEPQGRLGVLDRSWAGVVALDPEGEAIGVLRIMHDAPGWFSIWDVGVLPQWQGRRIGSAMMERALEIVRKEQPGAHVYLFTYHGPFYERLGFARQEHHGRRA